VTTSAKKTYSVSGFFIIVSDQGETGQEIPKEVIKIPEVCSTAKTISLAEQKKLHIFLQINVQLKINMQLDF
jgi:hypothetical protein